MAELKERNIGTGLHFRAVHLQQYYREKMGFERGMLPDTEWNSDRICSLPLFPDMTDGRRGPRGGGDQGGAGAMQRTRTVSVVIPVYNEEACARGAGATRCLATCRGARPRLRAHPGRRRQPGPVAGDARRGRGRARRKVVGVLLNRNYGQHAAVMAGFDAGRAATSSSPWTPTCRTRPRRSHGWSRPIDEGYDVVGTVRTTAPGHVCSGEWPRR